MSKRIKVTILGGSALATPVLFQVLGQRGARASYDFVMHGRNLERLELVKKAADTFIASFPELDITTAYETDFEAALEGADYCINQIRVGGLEGRAVDETFPRQFGIPGEETVGPGGFNNSLRGIPVILDVCRIIEKVAPGVIMLNLSNPSSIIQYAIRHYTSVNVVGTCDSPVSLMESIAKMLSVPSDDIKFNIAGMHHFGWIGGALHDGKERLPEVLERIYEMPKLGTDPELIQALGIIPSYYHKYYFHPDRVLAETEGRTIRAHQLMDLADQMLESFRRWEPGTSPTMLARRGAVWYEKIVAPALLALAEGQTTEMVLSVDNNGALPWLPGDAIVEVPVVIQGGRVEGVQSVELPQFAQAMTYQNCTYEMLAAQSIVERDRDKALKALMSNLLVENFNQARGILSVIWPDEPKHQFAVLKPVEKESEGPGFKIPELYYGDNLVEEFNPPDGEYALITMEELWDLVKDRFLRKPDAVLFVRELDWYQLEAMERRLPQIGAIVGLGGGVAQDAAKYLAWKRHLPVDEFVSITSVDASVTKSIAARAGGHVTYIGYIVPRDVYIDYRLVQSAPPRLNRSGIGDILCAHTALWDWKYANENTGEAYDPQAASAMHSWLERVVHYAEDIHQVNRDGIRLIMQAFEDISIICRRFGSSRPQEASDHTFAYNAEFQTGKHFLHGELVALGTWIMANLQDNTPGFLEAAYQATGILWQPVDIGIAREELARILSTLNWYQSNFGRRYSVLNTRKIDQMFIDRILDQLAF